MQSFSRGWNFLQQTWKMAMADKDLLKPSVYTLAVGLIVSLIGIIPIALAATILGVLATSIYFMAANVIGSYTSTAYHSCLYLWARNTEQAGQDLPAGFPAPLAAVLGQ